MSYGKQSWDIASQIKQGHKEYSKISDGLFEDFRSSFTSEIDHVLALGYALHYVTDESDPNSNIYAKRILDSVGAERTEWSIGLDNATQSLRIKDVRDQFESKIKEIEAGKLLVKDIEGEIFQAIVDSETNEQQSLILRTFEIMTNRLSLDNESIEP